MFSMVCAPANVTLSPFQAAYTFSRKTNSLALIALFHIYHIPSHFGVWGNELVEPIATHAATRGVDVHGKTT